MKRVERSGERYGESIGRMQGCQPSRRNGKSTDDSGLGLGAIYLAFLVSVSILLSDVAERVA